MIYSTPFRRFSNVAVASGVTGGSNLIFGNTGDVDIESVTDSITLKGTNLLASDIPYPRYKIVGVQPQFRNIVTGAPSPLNQFRIRIFKTDTGVVEIFTDITQSTQDYASDNLFIAGQDFQNNVRETNGGVPNSSTPALTVEDFRLEFRVHDDSPDITFTITGNNSDPSPALRFFYSVPSKVHVLSLHPRPSKLSITGNSKLTVE